MTFLFDFMLFFLFFQVFKETAEQTESWISSKEVFLANEDLGVSVLLLQISAVSQERVLYLIKLI